jgi:hypothetical protein
MPDRAWHGLAMFDPASPALTFGLGGLGNPLQLGLPMTGMGFDVRRHTMPFPSRPCHRGQVFWAMCLSYLVKLVK